jgi:hypothetical protein
MLTIKNSVNALLYLFGLFEQGLIKDIDLTLMREDGMVTYMEITQSDINDRYSHNKPVEGVYYINFQNPFELFPKKILDTFNYPVLNPNLGDDNWYYSENDISLVFNTSSELKLILHSMDNYTITNIQARIGRNHHVYTPEEIYSFNVASKLKNQSKWAKLRITARNEGNPTRLLEEGYFNDLSFGKRSGSALNSEMKYLSKLI